MPLYEYYENAENKVRLREEQIKQVTIGTQKVCRQIAELCKDGKRILIDGWYGVDFQHMIHEIAQSAQEQKIKVNFLDFNDCYLPVEKIEEYRKAYVGEDPSFGWVNSEGTLEDLLEEASVERFLEQAEENTKEGMGTIIYGPGASVEKLSNKASYVLYADFTMQPMLWQMWDGELETFGRKLSKDGYSWKAYYYNDFYLLYRNKKQALKKIDFFIDAVKAKELKMMPEDVYQDMVDEVVKQPVKQVKILQPGPWGAYRYKDLWKVDGLECNAWNELAGIELSILIDIGAEANINIPCQNLMQRPEQLVGPYATKEWPDLLPLQVWLEEERKNKPN